MKKTYLFLAIFSGSVFAQADLSQIEQRLNALENAQSKQGYSPKISGSIQLDTAFYQKDEDVPEADRLIYEDGMSFRRVRLKASGKMSKEFGYESQFEMAGAKFEIKDLFISMKRGEHLVRLGNMKTPTLHEELMSSSNTGFLERGLGTNAFNFGRMTGLDFSGNFDKRMTYQVGVYTNGLAARDPEDKSSLVTGARLTGLVWEQNKNLIHLGTHYIRGSQMAKVEYKTRPVTRVSANNAFNSSTFDNTHQSEVMGAEVIALLGSTRFVYEAAQAKASPREFVGADSYTFSSHQFMLGHVLTGERRGYSKSSGTVGSLRPDQELFDGGWGAFEATARLSLIDLNDTANSVEIKGGKGQALSIGLMWVMVNDVQMVFDLSSTKISDSSDHVDQKINVGQVRVEVKF